MRRSKKRTFSNTLNDDLLLEVLIRLPDDCRAVIRATLVCKHWFSLINSNDYRNRKRHRHQSQSDSLPCTFIFRKSRKLSKPLYEYLPQKSQILHGFESRPSSSSNGSYLEFLPWRNVLIFSTYNDLLLLSPDGRLSMKRVMICNPLTRQCLELPQLPWTPFDVPYGGLVCEPSSRQPHEQDEFKALKLHQYRYRVMLICRRSCHDDETFIAMTLCSETRTWSESEAFSFRGRCLNNFSPCAASNGMLHWLEGNLEVETVRRIVAFDPFKDLILRFIDFPLDLISHGFGLPDILTVLRLGVVGGQLRLSQFLKSSTDGSSHVLKVWELNYDNDGEDENDFRWTWTLVHDVKVKKRTESDCLSLSVMSAFHPDNGNVIFLLSDNLSLYQYDIREEKMKEVGKIPKEDDDRENFSFFLRVFTLVHPLWPTLLLP